MVAAHSLPLPQLQVERGYRQSPQITLTLPLPRIDIDFLFSFPDYGKSGHISRTFPHSLLLSSLLGGYRKNPLHIQRNNLVMISLALSLSYITLGKTPVAIALTRKV